MDQKAVDLMVEGLASKIALAGLLSPAFVGLHGRVATECIVRVRLTIQRLVRRHHCICSIMAKANA